MWNTGRNINTAIVERRYEREKSSRRSRKKLSGVMAMVIGAVVTLEIMIAGAMVVHFDFRRADMIAVFFCFMVLYAGVVAVLTEN